MNFVVRNCTERILKMLKSECNQLNIVLGNSQHTFSSSIQLFKRLKKITPIAQDTVSSTTQELQ